MYYVEKTWSVLELRTRNTFCERNVCEEGGVSIARKQNQSRKLFRQRESQRNERYQVAGKVGLKNESLYVEIDFLSAWYGCRLFSPQEEDSCHSPC